MEQTQHDYLRLMMVSDEHMVKVNASPVHEAIQILAPLIFNSKAFEVKDGHASGFHALHIADELVHFDKPVSLEAPLSQVLHAIEEGMKAAVKRDIFARCSSDRMALEYTGMAEAVLFADECQYCQWYSEADPKDIAPFPAKIKAQVHKLIDALKDKAHNHQLLKARITLGVHWLMFANRAVEGLATGKDWGNDHCMFSEFDKGDAGVTIGSIKLQHGYHYQGKLELLCVTELTERMYHELCKTITEKKPFAAHGPPGTGKTESIKDFANKLGRHAFVINCDGLQSAAVKKIMDFAAKSDCWVILDEYNTLQSVLAEAQDQLKKICESRERELGFFVIMAPGHPKCTPVPNEEIFNAFKMELPDRSRISEVQFAHHGFQTWMKLGPQVSNLLAALESELSKTAWYDFGLRRLLAIIKMSHAILESSESKSEEHAVTQALILMNGAPLVDEDQEIFKKCVVDSGLVTLNFFELKNDKIPLTGRSLKWAEPSLVYRKAYEIEQTLKFRHGMMVISLGHQLIQEVAKANGWHLVEMNEEYSTKDKPLTCEQLFGTAESKSGAFVDLLKDSISGEMSKKEGLKLIVVSDMHDFSKEIAEKLNTLLDDNKVLVTPWGERLHLPADVRIVFDTFYQKQANPAFFSRLGMIYYTNQE